MARIRTIKPDFWKHEQLGKASPMARLTFAGLICFADDEGRGRANSDALFAELHPFCGSGAKARWKAVLSELEALQDDDGPLVVFYQVAGASFYWLPGFCRQQYIEKPSKSKLPPPPNSGNAPQAIEDPSPLEGKGREGKGREGKGSPPSSPSAGTPEPAEGTPEATPTPPAPSGVDQASIAAIVAAYQRWEPQFPVWKIEEQVKRALRLGIAPGVILRDVETLGQRLKIWGIVDLYEHPGRKGKNGGIRENQATERAPVLAERREDVQARQDEGRRLADEALAGMDPDELEGWKIDATTAAERAKIPAGPARELYIQSALRKRAADAFSIKGV